MKKYKLYIFVFILLLCGCSSEPNKKVINVAVTGSPKIYSEYYEKGIKKAYADVCEEYKNSEFEIIVNFYDDNDDYETADKITSKLVNDNEVTAILASSSPEICENQVYQTDKTGKLLISPHWIYNSTLEGKNYNNVFVLNYSHDDVGAVMKNIAKKTPAKKWAVCYAEDEISKTEIKCFNKLDNDINIVDSVKINSLASSFEQTVNRWKLLGVEGVVIIPYDTEGFNLLYKLKEEMPNLYVISDSSLDNNEELLANKKYFDKVYIVDSFFVTSAESKVFTDEYADTWEIHAYNALRMIVDTAISNNTTSPKKISEILHKNGYNGELENYKFNANGTLNSENFSYAEITNGNITAYTISKNKEAD